MKNAIERLLKVPAIAHIVRAFQRFGERNGALYAAAITYFSVLSIVPILMLAFAMLGMTITVLRPHMMDQVKDAIMGKLSSGGFADTLGAMLDRVFSGWAGVGAIAMGLALWTGSGWIGNLKKAVQVQVVDDPTESKRHPVLEIAMNIGTFLLLLALTLSTLAISALSTTFNQQVLGWLGLTGRPGAGILLSLVAFATTTLAGAVLFCYLFLVLPGIRIPRKILLVGSLAGGFALTVLQSAAGMITAMMSNNVSASIFGPVIVIMAFFNLYATLILLIAAWVGTLEVAPVTAASVETPTPQSEPAWVLGPSPARSQRAFKSGEFEGLPGADPKVLIPQDVAAKGVRVGAAVGYGLGAVTGIGLGALISSLVKGWFRRPKA